MIQDGPGISGGGDLIMELDDALVKQRPNFTSGHELIKSRENRLQSHIQHRLTELEGYCTYPLYNICKFFSVHT